MAGLLTPEQKKLAYRLRASGLSLAEVGRQAGCTATSVTRIERDRPVGEEVPDSWTPQAGHLTIEDREQILLGMARGESFSRIARGLGRAPSTVTREVANNGGQDNYQAWAAHQRAHEQARRPKPFRLTAGPLLTEVTERLTQLWSPQEISARLVTDYPDDEQMRVSHETIYQSLIAGGTR